MKRVILPNVPTMPLPFYLAVEEWVARNCPPDEYFFAWQVSPTIICGRHQDIAAEVNLDEAREQGVYVCRRKSGGGAVLADLNNVMFSYITPSSDVQTTFAGYTGMICDMLHSLGIDARPTGRNDIAVDGRKVAGNAFYKLPGRSIVHGTMLYDADFSLMGRLLTPSRAKRESKGVVSVPSRVTTLRGISLDIPCDEFVRYAVDYLCRDEAFTIPDACLKEIDTIMQTYLTPGFLRIGLDSARPDVRTGYIEGAGEFRLSIAVDADNRITAASLHGDFFPIRPVDRYITDRLIGLKFDRPTLTSAIGQMDVGGTIAGLDADCFIDLIFNIPT